MAFMEEEPENSQTTEVLYAICHIPSTECSKPSGCLVRWDKNYIFWNIFLHEGQGMWSESTGGLMKLNTAQSWKRGCKSLKTYHQSYNWTAEIIANSCIRMEKSRPESNWEPVARLENKSFSLFELEQFSKEYATVLGSWCEKLQER